MQDRIRLLVQVQGLSRLREDKYMYKCVCFYHCVPWDTRHPLVSPDEVNNKQKNGQNPEQDGYKHDPAESRNMKILRPRDQNPHHGATQLEKSKQSNKTSFQIFDQNAGNKCNDIFIFPAPVENTGFECKFKDWNS